MIRSLYADVLPAPIGDVGLACTEDGTLVRIAFLKESSAEDFRLELQSLATRIHGDAGPCHAARRQLEEFFRQERRTFDMPLAPRGTPFQRLVWDALCEIPFGETQTYGELARRIGKPGGSRAVGQANNRNPIAIVIPCHRVIGSDGELTGFGGGLTVKRALLDFERGQSALQGELFAN